MTTVFVTGAGFTRAFVPEAPLLEDMYEGILPLLDKYSRDHFPISHALLRTELNRFPDRPYGTINLERLMTRLVSGMPYDKVFGIEHERAMLLEDVKLVFMKRLAGRKLSKEAAELMKRLAKKCIVENVCVITFNYDTLFDEALARQPSLIGAIGHPWHPTTGYGVVIRDMISSLYGGDMNGGISTELLKLHGSVTWHVKKGIRPPYSLDSIVHMEPWLAVSDPSGGESMIGEEGYNSYQPAMDLYLERDPLIVPPILNKAALSDYPILESIWARAFNWLSQATQIIFIGYSLPVTDNLTSHLFSETFSPDNAPEITVVGLAHSDIDKERLKASYRWVYPHLKDSDFWFDGALKWIEPYVEASTE